MRRFLILILFCSGSALAANVASWRTSMTQTPLPSNGCFQVTYPKTQWQKVQCTAAPEVAMLPAQAIIGGPNNDTAASTGSISWAQGLFPSVTGLKSEKDVAVKKGVGTRPDEPNTYSLQLNTKPFATPACNGCNGWQQFIYHSGTDVILIEYWLLHYSQCASGWKPANGSCMMNSVAVKIPPQPLQNLGQLILTGLSTASSDTVILFTPDNTLRAMQAASVLGLGNGKWTNAEFGVFGEGGGSRAEFNSGTTMTVQVNVGDGAATLSCVHTGYAAESNNLGLVAPCCKASGSSIVFNTSNSPSAKPCGAD